MPDSPNCSPASAEPGERFTLTAWVVLSLLGAAAVLANAPAPRRLLLFSALVLWLIELFRQWRGDWVKPVVPWVVIALGSAWWSPNPATTAVDALWEVISPLAAGLLAMSLSARISGRYLWLPYGTIVFFAIPGVVGGLHEHAGFWPAVPGLIANAYAGRGVASTAGLLMVLSGGALLALRPAIRGRLPLAVGLLVLGFAFGILGYNRIFWLALPVGLLPWLVVLGRGRRRLLVGVAGALVLAAGLYVSHGARVEPQAIGPGLPPIAAASFKDDPRWQIWRLWIGLAEESPWLGYGYGSRILPRLGERLPTTGSEEKDSAAWHHAHNVLLNIVVQTGFFGLAAFGCLLAGLWTISGRQLADEKSGRWRLAALSLVLAALAKSMTDDFFWGPAGILMWLFAGIFAGLARRRDATE